MHIRLITPLDTAQALLTGCAASINQDGLEQRTAHAIGRSVGQFAVTDRSEEAGGRINYTVNTRDGAIYRCYLYGSTVFQKAMSFGQTPHSDAVCAAMTGSKSGNANRGAAAMGQRNRRAGGNCNSLLQSSGLC